MYDVCHLVVSAFDIVSALQSMTFTPEQLIV